VAHQQRSVATGFGNRPPDEATRRAGAYPYRAELEGTACTIDGAPGSLVKQGDWLERFPSTLNRRDFQPR
jgi:hypothetical protein